MAESYGGLVARVGVLVTGAALLVTPLFPWVVVTLPGGREISVGHDAIPQVGEVDPQGPSVVVLICALSGIAAGAAGLLLDRRIAGLASLAGLAAAGVLAYFGYRVSRAAETLALEDYGLLGDLLGRVIPRIGLAPGWYAALLAAIAMTAAGAIAAIIGLRGRAARPPRITS